MLQRLYSPIQNLVFEVTLTEYSQLDAIPWSSVDRTVGDPDNPQFRALARVMVLVKRGHSTKVHPAPVYRDVVSLKVAERLPVLNLLGLLRCDTAVC